MHGQSIFYTVAYGPSLMNEREPAGRACFCLILYLIVLLLLLMREELLSEFLELGDLL